MYDVCEVCKSKLNLTRALPQTVIIDFIHRYLDTQIKDTWLCNA